MAVELEIRDGSPWWVSPDLWTVPFEPEGPPGQPVVGEPCFLWARVRNNGTFDVSNATVRFYWANPAVGFDRSTAHLIGTSFVNLDPGAGSDVLCLTPWVPVYVNQGHECILAEAYHTALDPLPATPEFNVPTDRHVAQRNLSVVLASSGFFHFVMTIHNSQRNSREFLLEAAVVESEEAKDIVRMLPDVDLEGEFGALLRSAFVDDLCPGAEALEEGEHRRVMIEIPGGSSVSKTLIGEIEAEPVLIHVRQIIDDLEIGGLSVLVLPPDNGRRKVS